MRLLALLALACGAFAAALPAEVGPNPNECGIAFVQLSNDEMVTGHSIIVLFSDGGCHNPENAIGAFLNEQCGDCVWFEGENCQGKHTYSGGEQGHHNIPTSKSYRCAHVF